MALTGRTGQQGGWPSKAEQLAPLTNKATQGYGWQRQAAHLASTHAAFGMAAMTVAGQAPRHPPSKQPPRHQFWTLSAEIKRELELSKVELAKTLEPRPAKLAGSERQAARETSRILNGRAETPAAQFATGDNGIGPPEDDRHAAIETVVPGKYEDQWRQTRLDLIVDETLRLSHRLTASDPAAADKGIAKPDGIARLDARPASVREELDHWKNENRSLQTSVDLLVGENDRLSRCLAEKSALGADKLVAELEGELGSARRQLVFREEQNRSLEASLALMVSENSRLSRRFAEKSAATPDERVDALVAELGSVRGELIFRTNENRSLQASLAAADKARSQLEQMRAALIAAEARLSVLASALNEADQKRQTEISTLHTRLEAMSSRAVAAEQMLADAQKTWLLHIGENSIVERKVADATEARKLAEQQLGLLQNSLQVKKREVQELEASRSEVVDTTNKLLKSFKAREIALARSHERVKMLTERVAQLEADANLAKQKTIDELNAQLQRERTEAAFAERAHETALMVERQSETADAVTRSLLVSSSRQALFNRCSLTLSHSTTRTNSAINSRALSIMAILRACCRCFLRSQC